MIQLTCHGDDSFWFLCMSSLVDEHVREVIAGNVGRGHPSGRYQGNYNNPENKQTLLNFASIDGCQGEYS